MGSKKHPLQNRTNVRIKGGGVKGLLNNVKKNCTFLKCRLPLSISPIFPSGISIVLSVSPIFPVAGSLEETPFSLHWHSFYHISFLDFKSGQKCENLSSSVEEMAVQLSFKELVRNVELWPLIGSLTASDPFVFGKI